MGERLRATKTTLAAKTPHETLASSRVRALVQHGGLLRLLGEQLRQNGCNGHFECQGREQTTVRLRQTSSADHSVVVKTKTRRLQARQRRVLNSSSSNPLSPSPETSSVSCATGVRRKAKLAPLQTWLWLRWPSSAPALAIAKILDAIFA